MINAHFQALKSVVNPQELLYIFSHVLDMDRLEVLTSKNPLSKSDQHRIDALVSRLQQGEPLAYLLGSVPFYNCLIQVTPEVLIPRVETEQLVELVLKEPLKNKRLADLFTGSGCIGIALKKQIPTLEVVSCDICEKALQVAKNNSQTNHTTIEYRLGNFLEPIHNESFDIIVANPPYVSDLEYNSLEVSVKKYEPKLALVANENGLYFYRRLSEELPHFFSGKLFLEIGKDQRESILQLFSTWKEITVQEDYAGHPRFAICSI